MTNIHPLADVSALRMSDHEQFYRLFTHPEIMPFLPEQSIPQNLEAAKQELADLISKEWQHQGKYWGIYHQNQLIGTVGLHSYAAKTSCIEISYEVHPDFWGHGIATNATIYCVQYAKKHMRYVKKIKAYTLVDNIGSHRVAEKCGFIRIGILKNDCYYHGKLINRMLFEIDVDDHA